MRISTISMRKSIQITDTPPSLWHVTPSAPDNLQKSTQAGKGAEGPPDRPQPTRRETRPGRSLSVAPGVRHRAPHVRGKGWKGAWGGDGGGEGAIEEAFVAL